MKPNPDFKIGDIVRFGFDGMLGGKWILLDIGTKFYHGAPTGFYTVYTARELKLGNTSQFTMFPKWTIHHVFNALQRLKRRYET